MSSLRGLTEYRPAWGELPPQRGLVRAERQGHDVRAVGDSSAGPRLLHVGPGSRHGPGTVTPFPGAPVFTFCLAVPSEGCRVFPGSLQMKDASFLRCRALAAGSVPVGAVSPRWAPPGPRPPGERWALVGDRALCSVSAQTPLGPPVGPSVPRRDAQPCLDQPPWHWLPGEVPAGPQANVPSCCLRAAAVSLRAGALPPRPPGSLRANTKAGHGFWKVHLQLPLCPHLLVP